MHTHARDFIASVARERRAGLVVEIGGLNINGSIRSLFDEPYLSVDCVPGPGVDVVANGATFVPDHSAACVVCCEVLEHTTEAEAICRNAHWILMDGGVFLVTAAGVSRAPHSAVDGRAVREGEFYRNVSREALTGWLDQFASVQIETGRGVYGLEDNDIYARAVK